MSRTVAVRPRSPIGYNEALHVYAQAPVAVCPRSPIGYNSVGAVNLQGVAVCPRSPIGYNPPPLVDNGVIVVVCPRSPIGYNYHQRGVSRMIVAVCPRSPIGYNLYRRRRPADGLRFAPDLPSAIMHGFFRLAPSRCGSPPISHRL